MTVSNSVSLTTAVTVPVVNPAIVFIFATEYLTVPVVLFPNVEELESSKVTSKVAKPEIFPSVIFPLPSTEFVTWPSTAFTSV